MSDIVILRPDVDQLAKASDTTHKRCRIRVSDLLNFIHVFFPGPDASEAEEVDALSVE